jgi:transposase
MEHGSPSLPENAAAAQQRIQELEQIVESQQEAIAAYQAQVAQQAEQLQLMKRALFGQRRERYAPSPDQQLLFAPEAVAGLETPAPSADTAEEELSSAIPPRKKRAKKKRIVFPQCWERRRTEHPLPPEEIPCPCCGTERTIIGEHVTAQMEIEPAQVYVEEHVRYTYACPACRDGSQMKTTEKPPQAVEKSPFGASVLALLVTWKFNHHLPTYRHQELLLGPLRQWLSRALLCGLLMRTAIVFLPLARLIRQKVLESASVNADETPGKMLRPGLGKTITGQVLGCAGDADHPYVFYCFHTDHSRAGPEELLAGYQGYLQTDGHVVYESLVKNSQGRLVDVACWAHGRRGFEESLAATSHVLVHEMLVWIRQLYDLESRAKDFSAADRRALRQAEALPILARMKVRLEEVRPALLPKSALAKAVDYVLYRWDAFVRYTEDGRIGIDNNIIERYLRPIAVGRKNYLFFGSERGGKTAATLYTLVQSARRNNVDVWPYLTDVLRRLPAIPPTDTVALEELLPDRWVKTHPEHLLDQRQEESREAQARRQRKRAARRAAAAV